MDAYNFDAKLSHLVVRQNRQSTDTAQNASTIKAMEVAIASLTLAVESHNRSLATLKQEVGHQRSFIDAIQAKLAKFMARFDK